MNLENFEIYKILIEKVSEKDKVPILGLSGVSDNLLQLDVGNNSELMEEDF